MSLARGGWTSCYRSAEKIGRDREGTYHEEFPLDIFCRKSAKMDFIKAVRGELRKSETGRPRGDLHNGARSVNAP